MPVLLHFLRHGDASASKIYCVLGVLEAPGILHKSTCCFLKGALLLCLLLHHSKKDKPAHFKAQQDKKVMVLGLLALLGNTPDAALPPEIAAGLPQLLSGLVRLLMDLKAQQDRAADAAEDDDEEPDEVSAAWVVYRRQCCDATADAPTRHQQYKHRFVCITAVARCG